MFYKLQACIGVLDSDMSHNIPMEGWSLVEMAAYSLIISFDKAVSSHFHKTPPFHWMSMNVQWIALSFSP